MNQFIYDIATTLAAPLGAGWLRLVPRRRELLGRFQVPGFNFSTPPIWVHACSVGELSVARPVLMQLRDRYPDTPLLLTVSTQTAHKMALSVPVPAELAWFPVDQIRIVRGFFEHVRPRLLVLMETEIWPNVLREAQARNIPAIVLNARLSDKHFARYSRWSRFFESVFARLSAVGVQHALYAERFAALGVSSDRIQVTGNIKFDNLATQIEAEHLQSLRRACGIADDASVVVFGSTRPGDEELAARCWARWKEEFPDAHLVIALRHANRLKEALAPLTEPVLLRSEVQNGRQPAGERILCVDTLGELIEFYALGAVAIIGGSFYPGVNGHNPLEPAALAVPTVFGPYMRNFLDPAEVLLRADAAVQVAAPEALCETVAGLLNAPDSRAKLARNARAAIAQSAGALDRSIALVERTLLKSEAPA